MADALACVIIAFPRLSLGHAFDPSRTAASSRKARVLRQKMAHLHRAAHRRRHRDRRSHHVLTYFLRGELTARFVAKVATVLLIAGGVLWYYFGSLRKADFQLTTPASASTAPSVSHDARAAIVAAIAIVVAIVLGFRVLGGPGTQRLVRSDETHRALPRRTRSENPAKVEN